MKKTGFRVTALSICPKNKKTLGESNPETLLRYNIVWDTIKYMGYYTTMKTFFVDCYTSNVEQSQKIDRFLKLLSNSGVCDLIKGIYESKSNPDEIGGRPSLNPYNMLAVILYNFAFGKGTLRDIEDRCKNDLRCIYLIQDEKPTHMSFGNFINTYILPNQEQIFSLVTKAIFEECKIDMDKEYLDGSKYEANANKYKFVWKPTTFHKKLGDKIRLLLEEYDLIRGIPNDGIIESKLVADKLTELDKKLKEYDLSLKENKKYKKDYELLVYYLEKSLEYEEKERICGPTRNSYYKTDKDSTAMCLKEDYYSGLGSNMHAAYNTQIMVANGLVTAYLVTQSRADLNDFVPILDVFHSFYDKYPKAICADSGYGSLENYSYLNENNIKNFVKYFSWQGNVSGSNPSQYHLNEDDTITCLNGNIGYKGEIYWHHRKANSTFYKVIGCNNCGFSLYCKRYMKDKSEDYKVFEVVVPLQRFIQQAEENLLSVEGIEMRVNRSSQVEGVFGVIKQDFQYERFRRRSINKVSCEFMLVCLGYNIRKLFRYFSGEAKFEYWKAPSGLMPEKFKKPSAKRLSKKASRIKEKSFNQEAKSKYKYAN